MSQQITYRGYKIETKVYQDKDTGKWVPRVAISALDEARNFEETPVTWEEEFDTQEEAENFALDGIEFYIDEKF
ncbi:MAG: hypothetical protein A3F94_01270 [Candidatus Spechtbacteria bacterium RIFCSPLOWO2_12_FULL_38_22]|uniref:DUF6566 domain-containing protein n=1 Tax=Candidatus Spechtbacteria bacterium RIFCSPLOWO2_12_FULL_38_22 TaxID=1802165 RepID=A0A1G2HIU6_9BACT|nr:MAG: hypothetical protein A2728_00465 [Candidatus Spechtbacteria bacterium RIFCSPHIGHO2_01_FULL_38_11]OGZ59938.1 MAG: hypothetical protein A3E58_00930 [Candidatus Spechtbacteria bacterium RIFCSPHIGHO2_12_FULL_38_30]OGZ60945.1 MAG: hypothetical protein A3A00_02325 [Candidatus Spechtbacteria bacterium RIFCSPLOWO2_01_FULL_38_20]OGZ61798.1 MAG: hypothetical protein A3F94_01270 [Candidatus Spechtbacteria bacterium RIFCSPLOWO2_12_FULL_38_22]